MVDNLKGFTGKQLRVNLNEKKAMEEPIPAKTVQKYLGGAGYAAKLLYDELSPGTDPLGPENKIIIATGPLSINLIPGGGSVMICFKSPLTNAWGESRCGSDFGPELKKSGFDHLILEGCSDEPVYLVIDDGQVEFKLAAHLSGKTVTQKRACIRKELMDEKYTILSIGPAGENLVRFATIMVDDRAAGRCGGGAVMGAKNLYAIAVRGRHKIRPAQPDRLKSVVRSAHATLKDNPMTSGFKNFGTIGDLASNDDGGDLPTKNWQSNYWGKGADLFDYYEEHNFVKPYGCYRGCPLSCGRKVKVKDGLYQTPEHGGAEYESISSFTAFVLNEDMDAAIHCSYLCNEYGLDTISAGAVIAFAIECHEYGLLNEKDTKDLDLSWGNTALLPKMVKMISEKESLGAVLADGVKLAAEKIGPESKRYAIHVKGLEGPAHDPRSGKALAVTYGTASRGMCHIHPLEAMAWDNGKMDWGLVKHGLTNPESIQAWDEDGKGKDTKLLQDGLVLPDILGVCKFFMYAGLTVDIWKDMLNAMTGLNLSSQKLLEVGERSINLQRMFNIREGLSPVDDLIPERIKKVPEFGKYKDQPDCAIRDFDSMLKDYYKARSWDPISGNPSKSKQKALGLP